MPMPTSTTISLIALLVSSGTTFVTYIRTYKQDIQENRRELRTLLERLIAIPREKIEFTKRYAGDRDALFAFDQICNQENTLLSRQAAEVARRLKSKYVSATEYLSIGFALQRAYNLQGAKEFLELASASAADFNDKIAAVRTLAYVYFLMGKPEDGRAKYREAVQIFSEYQGYDQYTQFTTNIQTELNWSNAEASVNYRPAAIEHLDRAEELVNSMPAGFDNDGWRAQVAQARRQFDRMQNRPVATPSTGDVVGAHSSIPVPTGIS